MLCVLAQKFPHFVRKAEAGRRKLAGGGIKPSDAVVFVRMSLRVGTALSFPGEHMHQNRLPELLCQTDGVFKLIQIMSVHRAQIVQAHIAEHIAGENPGFEPFL